MANTFSTAAGQPADRPARPFFSRLVPVVACYWLVIAGTALAFSLTGGNDFLGSDNDDFMRLVEVRDLLAGQGWFDLTQYRLGLQGGTLMHWSRLIDLPIALLIKLFSLFLDPARAEQVSVTIWPLLTQPLLLLPLALAARRVGGVAMMHIACALGALFIFTCIKFAPGAIDHHNVQLMLAMWMGAMLVDPQKRVASYVISGIACALAIAIGAETTPLVAAACLCVAIQWLWHGRDFSRPAQAFGMSLTLAISAAFFLTVPPRAYAVVTCDNLSLGFYALSALGGVALVLLASLPGRSTIAIRAALAVATGGLLLLAARVIAPECLGNPLSGLDPMLVELWLDGVTEARSILEEARVDSGAVGGFYAPGLFAIAICLFQAIYGKDREFHLVLLGLIAVAWGISLIQIRGAFSPTC